VQLLHVLVDVNVILNILLIQLSVFEYWVETFSKSPSMILIDGI